MTDITELAQSLKAAAENAIGAHERLAAYPYGEIIDISQHEGEQIDIDITDLNEFNKEANPVNILALVEALEKAQQCITELKSGKVGKALLERENHHVEVVGKLTERIAELESRTVTVNLASRRLPSDYVDGEFGNDDLAAIHNACRLECKVSVEKYLSAQGIVVKWEAE
ncbi:ead/Ea22-like family protein [Klebsiella quasipneumoniae]|uniref:ead/Ea22-like family protein n=1 Tax=Klebsiella quasipneumoniae TaxID=1463165 RepID=UPI00344D7162